MGEGAAQGLDATQRRELASLQGRAYGPDAEGGLDPDAAARLAELEAAGRAVSGAGVTGPGYGGGSGPAGAGPRPADAGPGSAAAGGPHAPEAAGPDPTEAGGPRPAAAAEPFATGRTARHPTGTLSRHTDTVRRRHAAAVAVVAVAGLVLAAGAAIRTAADAAPVVVARLANDADAGSRFTDPADADPPRFPLAEDMQSTALLGTVLGWEVWGGRSRSNFACLALVRSQTVNADCVSAGDFASSGVTVFLPRGDVAADLRPPELTGGAALAYAWHPDLTLTVEVRR